MGAVGRWIVHIYIASCGEGVKWKNPGRGNKKTSLGLTGVESDVDHGVE